MGRIGKITADPEVRRAKNGEDNVLMLTVRFSDGGIASVQWMPGAGEDTAPQKGDTMAVKRFGGVMIAVASKSPGNPVRKTGEREFYSRTPTGKKAGSLLLKTDGSVSLSSSTPAGSQGAVHAMKTTGTHYLGNTLTGQDAATVMATFLTQFEAYTAALISALTAATSGSPPPTSDPGALAAFSAINTAAAAFQTAIATLQAQWALVFDPVPPEPPSEVP
jgi:hypothetical protein